MSQWWGSIATLILGDNRFTGEFNPALLPRTVQTVDLSLNRLTGSAITIHMLPSSLVQLNVSHNLLKDVQLSPRDTRLPDGGGTVLVLDIHGSGIICPVPGAVDVARNNLPGHDLVLMHDSCTTDYSFFVVPGIGVCCSLVFCLFVLWATRHSRLQTSVLIWLDKNWDYLLNVQYVVLWGLRLFYFVNGLVLYMNM